MSKRRLLLINPWIYDFAAFNLWVEPIGLLSIGSILRSPVGAISESLRNVLIVGNRSSLL